MRDRYFNDKWIRRVVSVAAADREDAARIRARNQSACSDAIAPIDGGDIVHGEGKFRAARVREPGQRYVHQGGPGKREASCGDDGSFGNGKWQRIGRDAELDDRDGGRTAMLGRRFLSDERRRHNGSQLGGAHEGRRQSDSIPVHDRARQEVAAVDGQDETRASLRDMIGTGEVSTEAGNGRKRSGKTHGNQARFQQFQ